MGMKVSVGLSEHGEDRDRLERRRQAPNKHNWPDGQRPSRPWAWPLPDAADTKNIGPDWAW